MLIFWEILQIRNTLDGKTGASLKLTVLKDEGRVRTMVARRGESIVYAPTVATMVGDATWRIMESILAHPALLQPRLPL